MSRLIDADELISFLTECIDCKRLDNMPSDYFKLSELEFLISKQQTAYDVDKVVEQLTDASFCSYDAVEEVYRDMLLLTDVTGIVKAGGKE